MSENQFIVADYMWWGDTLEIAVYTTRHGEAFRVQMERAIDGVLKISGGGGYRGSQENVFESAKEVAKQWVQTELGYTVASKTEWSKVKSTRGMKFRDKQELKKLTSEERRELAAKLRQGEIEFEGESDD